MFLIYLSHIFLLSSCLIDTRSFNNIFLPAIIIMIIIIEMSKQTPEVLTISRSLPDG